MIVREGVYEGSKLKFRIDFPENFPCSRPEIILLSKTYHPMIDISSGKLDVERLIPHWSYGEKC